MRAVFAALIAYVQEQARVSMDETGWRQRNQRVWLGGAVRTWVIVLVVRLSRDGQVARELLGAGTRCGHPKTEGVCREILKVREALGTFVHLAGVEL